MKTIGIVGGGQLGSMLTQAAKKLNFQTIVLDPTPNSPAKKAGAKQIVGSLDDQEKITELAKRSDFLTWEIEHINTDILDRLSKQGFKVNPYPKTLAKIKDKLLQKKFLTSVKVPVAPFKEIKSKSDIVKISKAWGFPLILKARFGGYDGRGNFVIKNEEDIDSGIKKFLGSKLINLPGCQLYIPGCQLYIEKFVEFEKELAIIAARDVNGNVATYPVVQTIHRNNILHECLAPAPIPKKAKKEAEKFAKSVLKHLDGAGVFGIEMFLTKDKKILVNEIAPRVHNSGHFTIETCQTSQFEQHLRAITGMKLGSTKMKVGAAVMVNILGGRKGRANPKGVKKALTLGNVSVHIYGKKETRLERKMGHITVVGDDLEGARKKAEEARRLISI